MGALHNPHPHSPCTFFPFTFDVIMNLLNTVTSKQALERTTAFVTNVSAILGRYVQDMLYNRAAHELRYIMMSLESASVGSGKKKSGSVERGLTRPLFPDPQPHVRLLAECFVSGWWESNSTHCWTHQTSTTT